MLSRCPGHASKRVSAFRLNGRCGPCFTGKRARDTARSLLSTEGEHVPIIQRAGRSLLKVVAVSACVAALPAATANAALIETSACDDAALTKPFAPWGDGNWYKL